TVVMAMPDGHRDAQYMRDAVRRHGVSTLQFVPSLLEVFLGDEGGAPYPSLVRVMCGGEALSTALVRRFHERLPGVELHNLYGPTEAAVDVTTWRCQAEARDEIVPIGRPIANTKIYILDAH